MRAVSNDCSPSEIAGARILPGLSAKEAPQPA